MPDHEMAALRDLDLSIAMSGAVDAELVHHFDKGPDQEDLTFAYWRPSRGRRRYSALLFQLALPRDGERILQGNVAFTPEYLTRVLDDCPAGSGIALLHSHLGPGWQGMSDDDIIAERDRLAGVIATRTKLPLVGLTWGTDGTWSGRLWFRVDRHRYERRWVSTVRVAGRCLRLSYNPRLRPLPSASESQVATRSVWGEAAQSDLVRAHVGIVGLGSVGSIVSEALSRTGIQQITLIDHDHIEERNLDRTLGARREDVRQNTPKVEVATRIARESHTADHFEIRPIPCSVLEPQGLEAALDCDVIVSCVDKPWPRDVLNRLAYLHCIPVIDGGIFALVSPAGSLVHVDWRIHTLGPTRACLYCLRAQFRSDAVLDRDGMLDDPGYIRGLSHEEQERYARRNVFAFSLSVAAHEVLQLVGLVTGQCRVGGKGPQHYHAYPGIMEVEMTAGCDADCDIAPSWRLANDSFTLLSDPRLPSDRHPKDLVAARNAHLVISLLPSRLVRTIATGEWFRVRALRRAQEHRRQPGYRNQARPAVARLRSKR